MYRGLSSFFSQFFRREDGGIAVEAILMFPLLTWGLLATFIYFDAFRSKATNIKASYTISDAISRETDYITPDYLDSMYRLHEGLTSSNHDTKVRVTLLRFDAANDEYKVVWSKDRGNAGELDTDQVALMRSRLPVMPDNEVLILYQSWVVYEPAFSIGLDAFTFENTVFTRPRFSPDQLCYNTVNGGDYTTSIC